MISLDKKIIISGGFFSQNFNIGAYLFVFLFFLNAEVVACSEIYFSTVKKHNIMV